MFHARSLTLIAGFGALALVSAAPAHAATYIAYDTGVSSTNTVLPDGSTDTNYTITYGGHTLSPTLVRTSASFPVPYYLPDSSTSAWIGPGNINSQLYGLPGVYDYTTTVTASAAGLVSISGDWAADNTGDNILINGVSTGEMIPGSNFSNFQSYTPFSFDADLNAGANTLTFVVTNSDDSPAGSNDANPTALRVDRLNILGLGSPAPEPSEVAMLALLSLGVGGLMLRARRRVTLAA